MTAVSGIVLSIQITNDMKKTILLLNDDSYFYPEPLDVILNQCQGRIEKIYVFPPFLDSKSKKRFQAASVRIMGFRFVVKYLAIIAARKILSFLPLPLFLKKRSSIEWAARFHRIPIQKMSSVNDPGLVSEIQSGGFEIGLSLVSQIYRSEILSIPRFKLVNFHPSLLPRNKGKFPIFWALLNGDVEQGVTCHEINERIDDGKIIFQRRFSTDCGQTVPAVLEYFCERVPEYLRLAMVCLDNGITENFELGREPYYGPTPSRSEIKRYHSKVGTSLLEKIKRNYHSSWYLPLVSIFTAANVFFVFIPVEPIIVGGVLARPKSWLRMALYQTLAATLSTILLALVVSWKGESALNWIAPGVQSTPTWARATDAMDHYGLTALVLFSILPFPILPPLALAVFSKISMLSIALAVFMGRAIKFFGLCFLAAFFPKRFQKVKS